MFVVQVSFSVVVLFDDYTIFDLFLQFFMSHSENFPWLFARAAYNNAMLHNYHAHTARCKHASGTDREYVEQAILGGVKTLGLNLIEKSLL